MIAVADPPAAPLLGYWVCRQFLGSVQVPVAAQQVVPVAQSTVLSTH